MSLNDCFKATSSSCSEKERCVCWEKLACVSQPLARSSASTLLWEANALQRPFCQKDDKMILWETDRCQTEVLPLSDSWPSLALKFVSLLHFFLADEGRLLLFCCRCRGSLNPKIPRETSDHLLVFQQTLTRMNYVLAIINGTSLFEKFIYFLKNSTYFDTTAVTLQVNSDKIKTLIIPPDNQMTEIKPLLSNQTSEICCYILILPCHWSNILMD